MYFGFSKHNLEMTESINWVKQICNYKLGNESKQDHDLSLKLAATKSTQQSIDVDIFHGPFAWAFKEELKTCFPRCTINRPLKLTQTQKLNLENYAAVLRSSVKCKLWFVSIFGYESAVFVIATVLNQLENILSTSEKESNVFDYDLENVYGFEDCRVITESASFLNFLFITFIITTFIIAILLFILSMWYCGIIDLPLNIPDY